MTYIQEAFNQTIENAKEPETWYLCLIEDTQFYGGTEEGGWYGTDSYLIAYKEYKSKKLAKRAMKAVETLAKELEEESRKDYGSQCLREMDWLDARGLDADFLPEPDGPSTFRVRIYDHLPEFTPASRIYS